MRAALLAALLLPLAACDSLGDDAPDFGDPYRVVSADLDGTVLRAVVEYSGGCETHAFTARGRAVSTRLEAWLLHNANGDNCEALVRDSLEVPLTAIPAVLLTPDGGEIALR